MKPNAISSILLTALCLLGSVAWASTWYVKGVSGSDSNNCTSASTACKSIGHAISLALSGDSIIVIAATYSEKLTIGKNLSILGSGAPTTIIDGGGGVGTVVNISNGTNVTLSKVTIQNGSALFGGGINNGGTLTINQCTLSRNKAVHTEFGGGVGGGINNGGTLTINNSTFSGNSTTFFGNRGGGAVAASSTGEH